MIYKVVTVFIVYKFNCLFCTTRLKSWVGSKECFTIFASYFDFISLQDLGTPNEKIWPGVMELPGMKKCTFTEYSYNTLRNKFGQYLSDVGFDLLNR